MEDNASLKNRYDESLLSKTIDFLRFPMIVGVIFIHNYRMADNMDGIESFTSSNLPIYYYVSNLFSNIFASIAVPLFFFISGFLFFYKVKSFSSTVYLGKLKKRFRTLLVPYIFWNLLLYGALALASLWTKTSSIVEGYDYSLGESLIGKLNETGTGMYPLVYQLWFIRDLMVCVLISPLIYFIVTKLRYFGLILLGIGWYLGFSIPYLGSRGLSMVALFFFSSGAWLSCNRVNIVTLAKELKWIVWSYPLIAIFDLMTREESYNSYVHKLGILIGIIGCFLLVAYVIEKFNVKGVPFLSAASFFIFAVHDPWVLWVLRRVMFSVFRPSTDVTVTLLYFAVVFVVVVASLGVYWLLKKTIPSFTSFITGNR